MSRASAESGTTCAYGSWTRQQWVEKRIEAENGARLIESIKFKQDWTQFWTQTPRYGQKPDGTRTPFAPF
jgi:hypothetical protein